MGGDYVTSLVRTGVPGAWAALFAWLGKDWLPPEVQPLLVPVVLVAYFALVRFAEPYLPTWARRIVLGSSKAPEYNPPPKDDDGATVQALVDRLIAEQKAGRLPAVDETTAVRLDDPPKPTPFPREENRP